MIIALNDTKTILGGDSFPKLESVSLRLCKYVNIDDKNEKNDKKKKKELDAVVSLHNKHAQRISELSPVGAIQIHAKLNSRLIVNQAGGVLENANLCLHRHFGDPYIPGSAVKGIAGHAAWCEWNEAQDANEKQKIQQQILDVFGENLSDSKEKKHQRGCVAFLDAVPVKDEKPSLVVDITNCHHKDYYLGKKDKPTDNEQPNPQFFLAVEAGTKFVFTLVPLWKKGKLPGDAEQMLQLAKKWLIDGISIYGIGAKTGAGYGWFEVENPIQSKNIQVQSVTNDEISEIDRIKSDDQKFSEFAKNLASHTAEEKKVFFDLLRSDKKNWWKMKKKKNPELAASIRTIAEKLGVELQ